MWIYYVENGAHTTVHSVRSLCISGHLTGPFVYVSVQAARLTAACTHLKKSACDLLEDQAANWAQAGNGGCQLTEAEAAEADNERNKRFQLAELYTLYLNTVSSSLKVSTLVCYVVYIM